MILMRWEFQLVEWGMCLGMILIRWGFQKHRHFQSVGRGMRFGMSLMRWHIQAVFWIPLAAETGLMPARCGSGCSRSLLPSACPDFSGKCRAVPGYPRFFPAERIPGMPGEFSPGRPGLLLVSYLAEAPGPGRPRNPV